MPGFKFAGAGETREGMIRDIEGELWGKVPGNLSFLESGKGKWSRNPKCFCEINAESSEKKTTREEML